MDENTLIIKDDDGKEKAMEILFTFESPDYKKSYVLFIDPKEDDGQVYAMSYDDQGNLFAIENEEEWNMVEEVLEVYENEQEEEN